MDWLQLEKNFQRASANDTNADPALVNEGYNLAMETPASVVNKLVDVVLQISDPLAAIQVLLVLTDLKGDYMTYLTDVQRLFIFGKARLFLKSSLASCPRTPVALHRIGLNAWIMRGSPEVRRTCRENRQTPEFDEICNAIDELHARDSRT